VVELLLPMHIGYTSEFSGGAQTAGWLSGKTTAHKIKFETNQKNRLDEIAKKRKADKSSVQCLITLSMVPLETP